MSNTINSGSLTSLQAGETLLVQARKVAGGKIQLEFAEVLKTESKPANLLGLLNASDSRFSSGQGARRAWMTAEPADSSRLFGIDFTDNNPDWAVDQNGKEILELNVLNPVITFGNETVALKVQVVETVKPTEYQLANLETSAKRRGKDGEYISHKGMYVFANTTVVLKQANHIFLESDAPATTGITSGGIPVGVNLSTGEIF